MMRLCLWQRPKRRTECSKARRRKAQKRSHFCPRFRQKSKWWGARSI